MKEDYQKALGKLTLFSLLNPVSLSRKRLQNKFRKIPLLVTYYPTKFDHVIWSSFWFIPKITSANLCKPIHDIKNYSTFFCPFEFGKFGKEGKKLHKTEYLERTKRAF